MLFLYFTNVNEWIVFSIETITGIEREHWPGMGLKLLLMCIVCDIHKTIILIIINININHKYGIVL